jgi:8-oxo-dGTP pyrophosphatase MutT (NUDIX family)
MQRKYVYLFELDSVRDRDEEIIAAQAALYQEIIQKGNIVVLTYNQLVDSRGFFSLLTDETYYDCLLRLFERGCIRLSQFGDIRTVAQYILESIDEDKQFIYSALPLKFSQKRLTALVRRCLTYSDLSEIGEYLEGGRRTEAELQDLFLEVETGQDGQVLRVLPQSSRSVTELRQILRNLYSFLSIVMRLSMLPEIYLPPRRPEEVEPYRLHHILACVLQMPSPGISLWDQAVGILRQLPSFQAGRDGRSLYYRELISAYQEVSRNADHKEPSATHLDELKRPFQLAEAMVDLCYNYACEISICNISKHYDVRELENPDGPKPTFSADFHRRLAALWRQGWQADERFLRQDTERFEPFTHFECLPDFREAVRITAYLQYSREKVPDSIPRYEYAVVEQQKEQKRLIFSGIGRKFLLCFLCLLVASAVELVFMAIQTVLDDYMRVNTVWFTIVETLLFLLVTEWVSHALSIHWPGFLSLSQALGGIRSLLRDALHTFSAVAATAESVSAADSWEPRSQTAHIDFVTTKELQSYIQYRKQHPEYFTPSEAVPLADTSRPQTVRNLIRSMEIYHQNFGLVYRSQYNTLLVDPISDQGESYYPFERILPTAGNGVVMAVRNEGKFLLLKQYRHALRAEQYSFPRGYAEPGATPLENVRRELAEELHATVSRPPISLGFLEPDSGLTSRRIEVVAVEADDFQASIGHEGILDVRKVSLSELEDMIRSGLVTDGYTVGAVELWKLRKSEEASKE